MPPLPAMNVLIHSHPGDAHGIAVTCALRQRGHRVLRDIGFGVGTGATFTIGSAADGWRMRHDVDGTNHAPCGFDAVWFRRPVDVALPADLHPADRRFVAGEWGEILRAFRHAADGAFWVNPIAAISRATNKPTQLAVASRHGLAVPDTLITNDPRALEDFLARHRGVIFKPLHGALWEVGEKKLGAYTSVVTAAHLHPEEKIRACPGIYQRRVPKRFEVRAQFFGASCFAVRINSQALAGANVDWRRERGNPGLSVEPVDLPPAVHSRCRSLMSELGLVSGAFDFIVTPDDEWVFLEVNEAGQFIFLEMWRDELPVLDAFVGFLESRSPDFVYAGAEDRIRLATIFESGAFREMVAEDERRYGAYRHPGLIAERAVAG